MRAAGQVRTAGLVPAGLLGVVSEVRGPLWSSSYGSSVVCWTGGHIEGIDPGMTLIASRGVGSRSRAIGA